VKKGQANKKIIISGGGTGGHVFPAIAIADALCRQLDQPDILFVGARGRMEMDKVPQAGYKILGLPVEGFRRKLSLANLGVLVKLYTSLRMASRIVKDFSPDVVVGVGGYASGPVLRKAARMGIPTLIQEQNSYAGLTNRLLAKKALKICVAYEGMDKYFPAAKLVLTGNPVRKEIFQPGSGEDAYAHFGIPGQAKVLLILGGSLGARTINRAVLGKLDLIQKSGFTVLWQCGKYYYEEVKRSLEGVAADRIILKDFIERMDLAYQAADAIIARAGAITISELCLVGKAAILVPSPNVAEDHQTKNAKALADREAAIHIPDSEAEERMIPEARDLLADEESRAKLSLAIAEMAIENSADRIAEELIGIMKE
jgi:UDP-N-acetylglucosamine--N-acetylmuramyl-(pentapeptide) pyrophosphoryl-undecaprenol N-acetylglucosamine transferase